MVCALQRKLALKGQIESEGATVIALGGARPTIRSPLRFLAYVVGSLRAVRRICREWDVSAIQCHLSDAEFIGIVAGASSGVSRVISTVHYPELLPDRQPGEWRNRLRVALTKLLYRRWVHAVVAVSVDVARKLEEVFELDPEKIHVILNRIDVRAFEMARDTEAIRGSLGLGAQDRLLVSVGRLAPPKGHAFLLEAFAIVARKHENVKLLLVGDGELRSDLEMLSGQLAVADRVLFAGSREDVEDVLAMAEIFVLPSVSEGTSLALLEAMACGRPTVATDIPGNRCVIEHGVSGLLVPPGDARALAEAIDGLLENPSRAAAMGRIAHEVAAARYDIRDTVAELEGLWTGGLPG